MCYSYATNFSKEKLKDRYNLESAPLTGGQLSFFQSGFAHPLLPVVLNANGKNTLHSMRWGLIPYWVKSHEQALDISSKTLNAKAESLSEKPSFRAAFQRRRCLVPASGFFEWRDFRGKKYPHFIRLKNEDIMSFGGIWERWTDQQTGEEIHSFSIVTTPANELLRKIHNSKMRMPLILQPNDEDKWLQGDSAAATTLLRPFPDGFLMAQTISKRINSRTESRDVPEVQEVFEYPELGYTECDAL